MRRAALAAAALAIAGCGEDDLKGCAGLRRSDPGRALAHCNRALENQLVFGQRRAQAFIDRGALRADLKDWDPAIADFGYALALQKADAGSRVIAYYNRGSARLQKGELEPALADLWEALKLAPRHADAWALRSLARRMKGDLDGAIADAGEAAKLDSRHAGALVDALLRRAGLSEQKRDYERGIADLDALERLAPKSAAIPHARAVMRSRKGDLERALADASRAIELDPKLADGYNTRGWIRLQKKELDAAIADFDLALALNERHLLALGNRMRAWSAKKEFARTLADLEALRRFDPDAVNYRAIGLLHFYLGGYAESAAANAEALRRAPGDGYAALWRYLAQSRLGQAKEAHAALLDATKTLPAGKWPAAVVDHYLGKLAETGLLAAASDPDPRRRSEKLCEANFYAAMGKLLRNQTAQALPQLQSAERECPREFAEYDGAVVELKRLAK